MPATTAIFVIDYINTEKFLPPSPSYFSEHASMVSPQQAVNWQEVREAFSVLSQEQTGPCQSPVSTISPTGCWNASTVSHIQTNLLRNIRELHAVTGQVTMDALEPPEDHGPGVPPAATRYFKCLGFTSWAVGTIKLAIKSSRNEVEFCAALQQYGMTLFEAAYIFGLFHGPTEYNVSLPM